MSIKNKKKEMLGKEMDKEIKNYESTSAEDATFFGALKEESLRYDLDYTENGALVYSSSGSSLVDFNFNISSMRSKEGKEIVNSFKKAFYEDKLLAIRYLFFVGDIREGLGERHVFKEIMRFVACNEPEIAKAVLEFIPEYGRWDEVVELLSTPIKKDVVKLIKTQLNKDMEAAKKGQPVSLCAKWMPSINASKDSVRKQALTLCKELNIEKSAYRHMLSELRGHLNIIEKSLAEKDVEKLVSMQEILTSKQNYKYKDALMRLMPEERLEFFNKVLRGEANFNADVLEPHEIYYRYHATARRAKDMSYEVMWKQLPNKVVPGKEVLVIRDGSYSMTDRIPGTNRGTILDVASALTIYFSENSTGQFKDRFITFSASPSVVDLSKCTCLADKMRVLDSHDDCSNTNLEKTFDLILSTAIKNKMTQEQMPANLLIVSDMQFDSATSTGWGSNRKSTWSETLFDTIRQKYEAHGYKLPGLIFWNVNQDKTSIPEIKNELGLVLLGGYSKNNIDMICKNEFVQEIVTEDGQVKTVTKSPAEILTEKIMSERYDLIGNAVAPIISSI